MTPEEKATNRNKRSGEGWWSFIYPPIDTVLIGGLLVYMFFKVTVKALFRGRKNRKEEERRVS